MDEKEVNCIDKVCFLEYHFSKLCSIAVNNGSSGCNIPCLMNDCKFESHHNINCPMWMCTPYSTSTQMSTLIPDTTVKPDKPNDYFSGMISSVVMNILLLSVLAFAFYKRFKAMRRHREYIDPERQYFANDSREQAPIIRIQERIEMVDRGESNELHPNESAVINVAENQHVIIARSERLVDFSKFSEKKTRQRNHPV